MPPEISPMFRYWGRRPNEFDEEDLVEMLCPRQRKGEPAMREPLGLGTQVSLKNDKTGSSIDFSLRKSADGKTITLDSTLVRDNVTYKTKLVAQKNSDDYYLITQLTFDNHKEKLSSRSEISKVLAHIGQSQLKKACQGVIPAPHEERGKFGKFSRFIDRLMPNDPSQIPPPM
ncbi:MAG: hypothetical protein GC185_02865 [Alphaproteobacteria bacterium]|nr:hypothetical protein [Alphaproteobacteria bacterium]